MGIASAPNIDQLVARAVKDGEELTVHEIHARIGIDTYTYMQVRSAIMRGRAAGKLERGESLEADFRSVPTWKRTPPDPARATRTA